MNRQVTYSKKMSCCPGLAVDSLTSLARCRATLDSYGKLVDVYARKRSWEGRVYCLRQCGWHFQQYLQAAAHMGGQACSTDRTSGPVQTITVHYNADLRTLSK